MKKTIHQIHLWLSIPFGLCITLICFSGAMLVFEKEVMEWSHPSLYRVEPIGQPPLPLDELCIKASDALPDSVQVTGITVFPEPDRAYQVNLSKPRKASMYINPYTGEVTGRYERSPFFSTMFRMHRWMLGSARSEDGGMGLGKLIVGTSTLMFVIVLLSGIVIWWPRNRKALKHRLRIKFSKGWRRFWYDLHVAGGMYALVFLLAMALTGLTWSFQWYRNGFYTVFGVETSQGSGQVGGHQQKSPKGQTFDHWQQVYEQLVLKNPDFKQITLGKGTASVSFRRLGNQRASDKYTFNPRTGEITDVALYQDTPDSAKIRGWIYSVHVGSWGGLITRILAFLAVLLGASLPLTGYYLWIKRTFF